ncbi:MAG TPA: ABC transporter permease [Nocardioidaceae bacterium]|nr:ABC transporter permease [Nocardioidaceae bacterium]
MTTMTATGTMGTATRLGPVPGVLASMRAEARRVRKWPAVWITLGAWLALSAMFGYLFNYLAYTTGSGNFATEGQSRAALLASIMPGAVPDVLIDGMPMFGGALMMVLGALVAGNGYGWGTWKTIFTQGPSRVSAVLGSLLTLAGVVVAVVIVTLGFDLGLSLIVAATESQQVVWPSLAAVSQSVGAGLLVMGMWAMFGYLLGTLARGPALSVGLGLIWALVIENLLRGVGSMLGFVDTLTHFLPGTAAGSLVGSLVRGGSGDTPGVVAAISGERAVWTLAAYIVVLPLLSLVLVRRRDVA